LLRDRANNAASWQWVAGSGADAAPYFRIFNPVTQGLKFDPDGAYIRRWVPELAKVSKAFIHEPWKAVAGLASRLDAQIGRDYPGPIVDHALARDRALQAYAALRAG
jgi:deoxyribodipyrimidine photo-lyase